MPHGRLGAGDVSRIYRCRAKRAGIDPAADLGIAEVMQAGGWKSPVMVARYTEHLQARRDVQAGGSAGQDLITDRASHAPQQGWDLYFPIARCQKPNDAHRAA